MIYIFGAAFDPITKAHIEIIKAVNKHCVSDSDAMYVMISNNDEKNYKTSLDERFDVVQETIRGLNLKMSPTILEQDRRTYMFLKENFHNQDDEIVITVGEDEWNALIAGKWAHHDALLKTYKFLVFKREGGDIKIPANAQVTVQEINLPEVSSSKCREVLYRNPDCHYKDVADYIMHNTFRAIKENRLYNQNDFDYEKEEKEFITRYQKEKIEKGYGEPSVTADILAYNGNKVLLIRRGNYPFKNYWCLPGGFMDLTDADIDCTAAREFEEETTIHIAPSKFHQIKTYAHQFDPRMRIVDVAFSVRVNAKDMNKAVGSDDAAEARWFDFDDLPNLGFHHRQIIDDFLSTYSNDERY